jgi:hypothetical protein
MSFTVACKIDEPNHEQCWLFMPKICRYALIKCSFHVFLLFCDVEDASFGGVKYPRMKLFDNTCPFSLKCDVYCSTVSIRKCSNKNSDPYQYNFHESFDVSRLKALVFVTNVESPIMSPLCTVHGGNGK